MFNALPTGTVISRRSATTRTFDEIDRRPLNPGCEYPHGGELKRLHTQEYHQYDNVPPPLPSPRPLLTSSRRRGTEEEKGRRRRKKKKKKKERKKERRRRRRRRKKERKTEEEEEEERKKERKKEEEEEEEDSASQSSYSGYCYPLSVFLLCIFFFCVPGHARSSVR